MEKPSELSLTPEQLEELRGFAQALMGPRSIAIILGMDEQLFLEASREEGHPIRQAYMAGKLRTIAENNKVIIAAAKNGSAPAQELVKKLVTALNAEEAV